MFKISK